MAERPPPEWGFTASVQTHTHTLRHISVSLPPAWLIDCGFPDTLCRISILPLIHADTNSSRTAGDWGNGTSRCGRNPTNVTLHSPRDTFILFTLPFRDENLQMCYICVANNIWQSLRKNRQVWILKWKMRYTMRQSCSVLLGPCMTFSSYASWQPCGQPDNNPPPPPKKRFTADLRLTPTCEKCLHRHIQQMGWPDGQWHHNTVICW